MNKTLIINLITLIGGILTGLVSIVWFCASYKLEINTLTITQNNMQKYIDDRRNINEKRFSDLESRQMQFDNRQNQFEKDQSTANSDIRDIRTQLSYISDWVKEQREKGK